ncbi:hypothetical protein AVEN_115085-1 [Araneus ventricosus]|uniref:Uncharacterized protein n=1 Tax=Araneus ventricosus TaxID=182803 RepID=A0A4Y1ZX78_ARAVE|nr:hypothetical protein AVEN_115085-1 [Araneus ventricosus]
MDKNILCQQAAGVEVFFKLKGFIENEVACVFSRPNTFHEWDALWGRLEEHNPLPLSNKYFAVVLEQECQNLPQILLVNMAKSMRNRRYGCIIMRYGHVSY